MWERRGKLRRSKFIWSTPERVSTEYRVPGGERETCLFGIWWVTGEAPGAQGEHCYLLWGKQKFLWQVVRRIHFRWFWLEGRFHAWGLWEADCLHSDSSLSQGLGLEWEKKVRIPDVPGSKKQMLLYQRGQTQTQGPHRGPGCRNAFSNVLH